MCMLVLSHIHMRSNLKVTIPRTKYISYSIDMMSLICCKEIPKDQDASSMSRHASRYHLPEAVWICDAMGGGGEPSHKNLKSWRSLPPPLSPSPPPLSHESHSTPQEMFRPFALPNFSCCYWLGGKYPLRFSEWLAVHRASSCETMGYCSWSTSVSGCTVSLYLVLMQVLNHWHFFRAFRRGNNFIGHEHVELLFSKTYFISRATVLRNILPCVMLRNSYQKQNYQLT